MNNLLPAILIALTSGPVLVALLVTLSFLLPHAAEQAQAVLNGRSGRAFVVGLVNSLFFGVLAALLGQGGELLSLLAVLLVLGLLGLAALGLAGGLLLLQSRIYPSAGSSGLSVVQQRLRTAVLLVAALFAPIIGWFVLAPLLLVTCLGATIISLRRRSA